MACLYNFTGDKTVCSCRYLISVTFRKRDCVDLVIWCDWLCKFKQCHIVLQCFPFVLVVADNFCHIDCFLNRGKRTLTVMST